MITIQGLPPAGLVHPQLFLPQNIPRGAPLGTQAGFKPLNPGKRARSPTPPVSVYHQSYVTAAAYKPQPTPSYAPSTQSLYNNIFKIYVPVHVIYLL